LQWTQWFFRRRLDAPVGLVVLGSDAIADTTDTPNMQAARYESGLDNRSYHSACRPACSPFMCLSPASL
jgi:hypothetical protein